MINLVQLPFSASKLVGFKRRPIWALETSSQSKRKSKRRQKRNFSFKIKNKKREKNLQNNPAVHYFSKWFSQSQMEKKSEAAKSSTCWKTLSSLSKNEVVPTRYSRKIQKIKTGKSTHKLSFLFQFLLKIWLFGSSKEFGSKVSRFQVLILTMIRRASLISVMLRYLCNCYLFIFLVI